MESCDLYPSSEKGVQAYLAQCAKCHSTGSPFSIDDNTETLERIAICDGRLMLAMFLTVLYIVDCP